MQFNTFMHAVVKELVSQSSRYPMIGFSRPEFPVSGQTNRPAKKLN